MFVAVVYKDHEDTAPKSHRPEGGWECFCGNTEAEAVQQALTSVQRWETQYNFDARNPAGAQVSPRQAKPYGPYQILVGEVTQQVRRFDYELVAL